MKTLKKILTATILSLSLSSCGAFNSTIDKTIEGGKELSTHIKDEFTVLRDETLKAVDKRLEQLGPLIDERVNNVGTMLDATVSGFLNSDLMAFIIVALTCLVGISLIFIIILVLGEARARWLKLRNRSI